MQNYLKYLLALVLLAAFTVTPAFGQVENTRDFTTSTENAHFGNDVGVAGDLKFLSSSGGLVHKVGTLAATGSAQGDAAAIVTKTTTATASDGTKGIILPATPTVGDSYLILNTVAAALLVYPGTGDAINNTSANGSVSVAANASLSCVATSTSQWYCFEGAAP